MLAARTSRHQQTQRAPPTTHWRKGQGWRSVSQSRSGRTSRKRPATAEPYGRQCSARNQGGGEAASSGSLMSHESSSSRVVDSANELADEDDIVSDSHFCRARALAQATAASSVVQPHTYLRTHLSANPSQPASQPSSVLAVRAAAARMRPYRNKPTSCCGGAATRRDRAPRLGKECEGGRAAAHLEHLAREVLQLLLLIAGAGHRVHRVALDLRARPHPSPSRARAREPPELAAAPSAEGAV
jgi:hypothetical protein